MTPQEMVEEFHKKFNVYQEPNPDLPTNHSVLGRLRLLLEEAFELAKGFHDDDLEQVADALGDLAYIVYGTAAVCGIDLLPIIAEVHRSNMTKDPGYFKPVKGKNYSPPNIREVLERQMKNEQ